MHLLFGQKAWQNIYITWFSVKKYQFSFFLFHLSSVATAINYDLFSGLYMDINLYIWKVELS